MGAKKHIVNILKICLAVSTIWYLYKSGRLTKETFIRLLSLDSLPMLLFSSSAFLISQVISSVRIIFLLWINGIRLKLTQAFKLTMIGNFFNMVIPGMVGGDVIKGFYLAKAEETYKGRTSGIVIIDRAMGLLALLTIGSASALYLSKKNISALTPYAYSLKNVVIFSSVVLCLFAAFIALGKNKTVRTGLKGIALKMFRQGFIYQVIESFGAVTKKRRYLVFAFLMSIAVQIFSLAGLLIFINLTSGKTPDIFALVAVSSLVLLMGVIPVTPGNIGWTEMLASLGWSAVGSNDGATIFLYWRIVTLLCSLPWGIFYFNYKP